MTDTFKVLGQSAPAATTLTTAYTVPSATQAVSSSIVVCNRDAGAATFRISVAIAGAADNVKQYIAYDAPIAGNDTIALTIGVTLGATDVVRVYASTTLLSFSIYGEEVT